jgi:hypothetical protein
VAKITAARIMMSRPRPVSTTPAMRATRRWRGCAARPIGYGRIPGTSSSGCSSLGRATTNSLRVRRRTSSRSTAGPVVRAAASRGASGATASATSSSPLIAAAHREQIAGPLAPRNRPHRAQRGRSLSGAPTGAGEVAVRVIFERAPLSPLHSHATAVSIPLRQAAAQSGNVRPSRPTVVAHTVASLGGSGFQVVV